MTLGSTALTPTSRALATADLDQTIDQVNENNQIATGSEIEEQEQEEISQENINAEWNDCDPGLGAWPRGLCLRHGGSELCGSDAERAAVGGDGGTGIEAASEAVAVAELQQSADQDNCNAQLAILEPGDLEIEADQEQEEIDQENVSVQYGEAIADCRPPVMLMSTRAVR